MTADITGAMKRAWTQMLRDRGVGITLILFVCLLLLVQALFLSLLSVRTVSHLLTDSAAIRMEVLPAASEADIQQLYAALRVHPAVRSVIFLSRQQVYEQQKKLHPDDVAFLEQYNFNNPFHEVFSVMLTSLAAYNQFTEDMRGARWKSVVDPASLAASAEQQTQVRSFLDVTGSVYMLSVVLMVAICLVCIAAVFAYAKRLCGDRGHELQMRHLMGASPVQVLLPFTIEMTLLMLVALVVALLITGVIGMLLPSVLPSFAAGASFQTFRTALLPVLPTALPLFIVIESLCLPVVAYAGVALAARSVLPRSFILFP